MRDFFRPSATDRVKGFLPSVLIAVLIVLTLILSGAFFFRRGQTMMEVQLKDKLRSTAAAAATQFSGDLVGTIRDGDTLGTSPALVTAVSKLNALRNDVSNIRYAYIMKRTEDPRMLKFVADADLERTDKELDLDGSGTVDEDEEASKPGDLYDWTEFPVLGEEAFLHPSVDDEVGSDQWGSILSGYAPIRGESGTVIGILGIDMAADDFKSFSQSIFSPITFLLVAFAILCIAGGIVLSLWRRRLESLERLEVERAGLMRLAFHQLGGPLTIISWSLQELEESGPESIQRTIGNIHEGVSRLTGILKTLRDADLVHADRLEYKPEFASLSSVIKSVVQDLGTRLTDRGQHLRLDLIENITMRMDTKLIAGVLVELLSNAIDFSPNGSEIVVRSRKEGTSAVFEVEDVGCGIPASDLSRVFDEFTRGANATKFKADGNGLGLYIVHGIVKRSGGTIAVRSREGKGTTVTVKLPIV